MTDPTQPASRGRPRSERAHHAVVAAAGALLLEGGMAAATMEAIAERAGVSKATLYKWWPSRGAVMLEGLFDATRQTLEVPEGVSTEEALRLQLAALIDLLVDGAAGPLLRALAGQAESDATIAEALRDRWLAPRRAVGIGTLRQAIARGELRADTDVEAAADQLFAPIYHRLMFGHAPLEDDLPARLVEQLLRGLRV